MHPTHAGTFSSIYKHTTNKSLSLPEAEAKISEIFLRPCIFPPIKVR